jgi:hypothetical protein
MSLETLPDWGMTRDGVLFERPTPERLTRERACSSSPGLQTPTANAWKSPYTERPHRFEDGERFDLQDQIAALLPTPRAMNGVFSRMNPRVKQDGSGVSNLEEVLGHLTGGSTPGGYPAGSPSPAALPLPLPFPP